MEGCEWRGMNEEVGIEMFCGDPHQPRAEPAGLGSKGAYAPSPLPSSLIFWRREPPNALQVWRREPPHTLKRARRAERVDVISRACSAGARPAKERYTIVLVSIVSVSM